MNTVLALVDITTTGIIFNSFNTSSAVWELCHQNQKLGVAWNYQSLSVLLNTPAGVVLLLGELAGNLGTLR